MAEIILGLGVGQCGLKLLSEMLCAQPDTLVTYEDRPFLPWQQPADPSCMATRLERWRKTRSHARIGDVASFYLPYMEELLEIEPHCRILCLHRPKPEVLQAIQLSLEKTLRPTDNWRKTLPSGWYRDPQRMIIYPQYNVPTRLAALERYYEEYAARTHLLSQRFPERFRLFDPQEWETEEGVRKVLTFAGIPLAEQKIFTVRKVPLTEIPLSEEKLLQRWNETAKGGNFS
ncbi:MAG: hypothetical protein Q4D62_12035 [Planctomycetia bacterium]|nr:hypothetical protein [Planctomycetia bacterium]